MTELLTGNSTDILPEPNIEGAPARPVELEQKELDDVYPPGSPEREAIDNVPTITSPSDQQDLMVSQMQESPAQLTKDIPIVDVEEAEPKEKIFKEIDPVQTQQAVSSFLEGFINQSGKFDPNSTDKDPSLAGKTAKELLSYIEERENSTGKESSITQALKKELAIIANKEEKNWFDWTIYHGYDQLKGINHMAYQAFMMDKWSPLNEPPRPETTGGNIAGGIAQGGFSYAVGAYVAPAQFISKTIPALESFVSLPAIKTVLEMGVGESLTLPSDWRTSSVLRDMFGIDDGIIGKLAASENENIFDRTWRNAVDGMLLTASFQTTAKLVVPPLLKFGKKLYKTGAFVTDKLTDVKPFKSLLNSLKGLQRDFEELYPKEIVKPDKDVSIKEGIQSLKNKIKEEKTGKPVETVFEPLEMAPPLHRDTPPIVDVGGFKYENPTVPPIPKEKLPPEAFVTERQLTLKNISSEKVKKKFKANRKLPPNTTVEVRPTIAPADMLNTKAGKRVLVTVHKDSKNTQTPGTVLGYDHAVTLRNVEFKVNQEARYSIASGKSTKFPAMTARGDIIQTKPVFEGIEVNFNPKDDHLFRVVENGLAIRSAEEAIVFDKRVLVRGKVTYWDKASAPKPKFNKKSNTQFKYESRKHEQVADGDTSIPLTDAPTIPPAPIMTPEEVEHMLAYPLDTTKEIGRLNLNKIINDNDVIKTHKHLSDILPEYVPMTVDQMKRGAEKWIAELKTGGIDIEQFLKHLGSKTHELPYQVLAARILHGAQIDKVTQHAKEYSDVYNYMVILRNELNNKIKKGADISEIELKYNNVMSDLDSLKDDWLTEYSKGHQITGYLSGVNTNIARTQVQQKIPISSDMIPESTNKTFNTEIVSERMKEEAERIPDYVATGESTTDIIGRLSNDIIQHTEHSQTSSMLAKPIWNRLFEAGNFININGFLSNLATTSVNVAGTGMMNMLHSTEKILATGYGKLEGELIGWSGIDKILPQNPMEAASSWGETGAWFFGATQSLIESAWFTESKMLNRSALGKVKESFIKGKLDGGDHELQRAGLSVGEETLDIPFTDIKLGVPDPISKAAVNDILRPIGNKIGIEDLSLSDQSIITKAIQSIGITTGIPGRTLLAQDSGFREIAYRQVIHALSWREAEKIVGSGSSGLGATFKEKKATYREVIQQLPEHIHEAGKLFAEASVFQGKLSKKGLEYYIGLLEKARKVDLEPEVKNFLFRGLDENILSSGLLYYVPFIKTPYFIQKEMMWNRGPVQALRIARMFLTDPDEIARFATSPRWRSEVAARVATGSGLMALGYYGYKGIETEEGSVQINLNSEDSQIRDLNEDANRLLPDVTYNNILNGTLHSIPIGRADPLASPVIAGAVAGLFKELANELEAVEDDPVAYSEKVDEIWDKLTYQIGSFVQDKTVMNGIKEIFSNLPGLDNPYADPARLINNYLVDWLSPTFYKSLREAIARAKNNQRFLPQSSVKEVLVKKNKKELEREITLIGGKKIKVNWSPDKIAQADFIMKLTNQWIDRKRKLMILDTEVDPHAEGKDGPIKRGCCWAIDLEGNFKGFSNKEETFLQRIFEQVLSSISFRKVEETNTAFLVRMFNLDYKHPKRWTSYQVPKTRGHIPLSPFQQTIWLSINGELNRTAFNTPRFQAIVDSLKRKEVPSESKVPDLADPAKFYALQKEIKNILMSNKSFSATLVLEKPEWKSILDKALEVQLTQHPEILSQLASQAKHKNLNVGRQPF